MAVSKRENQWASLNFKPLHQCLEPALFRPSGRVDAPSFQLIVEYEAAEFLQHAIKFVRVIPAGQQIDAAVLASLFQRESDRPLVQAVGSVYVRLVGFDHDGAPIDVHGLNLNG